MANEVRLIDANALLEKLSRMIEYCKTDSKVNGLTALFQVGDAVMDCPTVDAVEVVRDMWIPVTERLPEDEKKVLCILDDGFFCILEWASWDWLWSDGHNVYAEKDVTHWMPLPEPPKGE